MDPQLLSAENFPLVKLPTPVDAYNVDGTLNKKGAILWKVKTVMTLGNFTDSIELMIVRLGQPQVILGMPWLRKWNPKINWDWFSLTLPPTSWQDMLYHAWYLLCRLHNQRSL